MSGEPFSSMPLGQQQLLMENFPFEFIVALLFGEFSIFFIPFALAGKV